MKRLLQDYSTPVNSYFMLNAAVPAEAYDDPPVSRSFETSAVPAGLIHDAWRDYPAETWAAFWHRHFFPTDDYTPTEADVARSTLTWKGRFKDVLTNRGATVYNYYSDGGSETSGDEVFELLNGTPDPTEGFEWSGEKGQYSWQKQECYKGRYTSFWTFAFAASDTMGWGFSADEETRSLAKKGDFSAEQYRVSPIFNQTPGEVLGNSATAIQTNRNHLLAYGIPAMTKAAGRSVLSKLDPVANEECQGYVQGSWGQTVALLAEHGVDVQALIEAENALERLELLVQAADKISVTEPILRRFRAYVGELERMMRFVEPQELSREAWLRYDAVRSLRNATRKKQSRHSDEALNARINAIISRSTVMQGGPTEGKTFDLSKIDFTKLKHEVAMLEWKNLQRRDLEATIRRLLSQTMFSSPLRTDFHEEFLKIMQESNHSQTKEELEKIILELIQLCLRAQQEAIRYRTEGFRRDEELQIYELVLGNLPNPNVVDCEALKQAVRELMDALKSMFEGMHQWTAKAITQARVRKSIQWALFQTLPDLPNGALADLTKRVYDYVFETFPNGISEQPEADHSEDDEPPDAFEDLPPMLRSRVVRLQDVFGDDLLRKAVEALSPEMRQAPLPHVVKPAIERADLYKDAFKAVESDLDMAAEGEPPEATPGEVGRGL